MIDRFLFARLTDSGERAAVVERCHAVLAAAPEAIAVTAGTPADDSARSWDLSLVVRCADLDALAALLARPDVVALLDWLGARAAIVKAWSFDVAPR